MTWTLLPVRPWSSPYSWPGPWPWPQFWPWERRRRKLLSLRRAFASPMKRGCCGVSCGPVPGHALAQQTRQSQTERAGTAVQCGWSGGLLARGSEAGAEAEAGLSGCERAVLARRPRPLPARQCRGGPRLPCSRKPECRAREESRRLVAWRKRWGAAGVPAAMEREEAGRPASSGPAGSSLRRCCRAGRTPSIRRMPGRGCVQGWGQATAPR
mmetsp:Transcript_12481/g.47944  ORF Transcript_12481/g.47944 Transcript_12481/m.47944 type:complete len:212 (+) Transcript_12481:523-1158(+)